MITVQGSIKSMQSLYDGLAIATGGEAEELKRRDLMSEDFLVCTIEGYMVFSLLWDYDASKWDFKRFI